VGLSDARGPEEQHVGPVGDEPPRRQLLHQPPVDRWLGLEVEVLQRLLNGEMLDLYPHSNTLLGLGGHLLAGDEVEKVEEGEVVLGCLLEEAVDTEGGVAQLQALAVLEDALMYEVAHGVPATMAA